MNNPTYDVQNMLRGQLNQKLSATSLSKTTKAVKRINRPIHRIKSHFRTSPNTLARIELIYMIRKGQMAQESDLPLHQQFDTLAALDEPENRLSVFRSSICDRSLNHALQLLCHSVSI